jgi:hypothetical protein
MHAEPTADASWAASFKDVLTGVGAIEYQDAETFQRRNEALLGLVPRSDEILLSARSDRKRGLMRRLQGAGRMFATPGAGVKRTKRLGRPRKDDQRDRVRELKNEGKSWGQIQIQMNKETGQTNSKDAYRKLVRRHESN